MAICNLGISSCRQQYILSSYKCFVFSSSFPLLTSGVPLVSLRSYISIRNFKLLSFIFYPNTLPIYFFFNKLFLIPIIFLSIYNVFPYVSLIKLFFRSDSLSLYFSSLSVCLSFFKLFFRSDSLSLYFSILSVSLSFLNYFFARILCLYFSGLPYVSLF